MEHSGPLQDALRTGRRWIRELSEATGLGDDQQVYHALCATLRAVRDLLPRPLAVQLGSQLPVLVRGLYYDGWRPSELPGPLDSEQEFIRMRVAPRYHARPLADLTAAVRAVFAVLSHNLAPETGQALQEALPEPVQGLWPASMPEAGGDQAPRAAAR